MDYEHKKKTVMSTLFVNPPFFSLCILWKPPLSVVDTSPCALKGSVSTKNRNCAGLFGIGAVFSTGFILFSALTAEQRDKLLKTKEHYDKNGDSLEDQLLKLKVGWVCGGR